jgi:hypothetical protein
MGTCYCLLSDLPSRRAYVYGRRPTAPQRRQAGRPATGRRVAHPEACQVLLHERHPAYISWEQFERNRRQLEANAQARLCQLDTFFALEGFEL